MLTCTEAVRPEHLAIWVKFYVESEIQVENTLKNASRTRTLGKTNLRKIEKNEIFHNS